MRCALIFIVTLFFAWPAKYLAFSLHSHFGPVAQLGHVPGGTSTSRVASQRSDMISVR